MDDLVAWITSHCEGKPGKDWSNHGASTFAMEQVDGGDRVLRATKRIEKGLRLCIPPACIVSEDKVRASPVGVAFAGLDRYTLFAMFLIWHERQGDKSFYAPYLAVLPRDIRFHPITFASRLDSEKELAEAVAKEPLLAKALAAQDSKLRQEFAAVQTLLRVPKHAEALAPFLTSDDGGNGPTYGEFIWASCMIVSRAFDMDEPKMMVMLPFADSMNHDASNPNVLWRPRLPKGFFVVSFTQVAEKEDELTANYHGSGGVVDPSKKNLDDVRQYVMYGFVETSAFSDIIKLANVPVKPV